jgi:hypothetical protein
VEDRDLLRMAKLSRASTPVDLMSYAPEDQQPSVFLLKEDRRHATLTVFNWTGQPRSHKLPLQDLGLSGANYGTADILERSRPVILADRAVVLENQPPHSVRMIRLTDTAVAAAAPTLSVNGPAMAEAGDVLTFSATADAAGVPALSWHWDFGDGVTMDGRKATHAYTLAGDYAVEVTADGVDGIPAKKSLQVHVNGTLHTPFQLENSRRYTEKNK